MSTTFPDILPMLGRGKHRNPRRGACFMELASFLAGEEWSDSPGCTHEALAHLARLVNDFTSDEARPQLAPLIPSVIGVRDLGAGFDDEVAMIAATYALPIASLDRQRGLAVGVLRTLGELDAYRTAASTTVLRPAQEALDGLGDAGRWAREFARRVGSAPSGRSSARAIVEVAVRGIAEACVPDHEARLRALLREVIAFARARARARAGADAVEPAALAPAALAPAAWRGVLRAAG